MPNLLEETKRAIKTSGHTVDDIVHIGNNEYKCTWQEFENLANVEYDNGYGAQEVAKDLIIVFSDGQTMWREEYDGSEWWAYSTPFKIEDKSYKPIKNLVGGMWADLEELND